MLLLESMVWLCIAQFLVSAIPFRHYARYLGSTSGKVAISNTPVDAQLIADVKWAISVSRKYLPWKLVCLPQAVASKFMLRRRRVTSTLYLGITMKENSQLNAHAWLKVGDVTVTGEKGKDQFSTVATFT